MPRTIAKPLTDVAIRNFKADPVKRREIPDAKVPGLYLVIQPGGKRSWAFRYRFAGKPQKFTLGPLVMPQEGIADDQSPAPGGALTLNAARHAARTASNEVATGKNPSAAKREAKRSGKAPADKDLFKNVVKLFIAKHSSKLRSAEEVSRMLNRDVLPPWGDKNIQSITKRDVIDLLDAIRERGADVMANRVFAATRKLFNWACARDIIKTSPCDGVKPPSPETMRDRTLNDDELRCFWHACDKISYPFGPLFKMLLLTGQRLSEVADMTRSEVKAAEKLWTIPRERAKNNEVHDVPLSGAALQLLGSLKKLGGSDFYFTTTGKTPVSGFSRAKTILDNEMLKIAEGQPEIWGKEPKLSPWRIHDLRRTAASNLARLGVNLPVIEKVLNHQSGSFKGIVKVYQRHSFADEKRKALEEWAGFLLRLVEPKQNNVIEMWRG